MYIRLILGTLAAFFAIMLWSKTKDPAWKLVIIGTAVAYIEIVYHVLEMSEIAAGNVLFIGSVSVVTVLFSSLRTVFFVAAFLVMVIRQYRHH